MGVCAGRREAHDQSKAKTIGFGIIFGLIGWLTLFFQMLILVRHGPGVAHLPPQPPSPCGMLSRLGVAVFCR